MSACSVARQGEGPAVTSLIVSIVSHGHGEQVRALLHQLAGLPGTTIDGVVLTLNHAEPELATALDADGRAQPWPFQLVVHQNPHSQGFGANHNQAFRRHALVHWRDHGIALDAGRFAIVNPDIALQGDLFPPLLARLAAEPMLGCVCPVQVDAAGQPQDFARRLPTPASIAQRALWSLRRRLGLPHAPRAPGQAAPGEAPDWVNAAFWLVRAQAWQATGGFDDGYFMYGEDVDACLRLQLAGWGLAVEPGARVMHVAQRNSRRNAQHLRWHLASLWRLWQSGVYRQYRRQMMNAPR
jgi:GT2 family glycosyltransferase